MRGPPTRCNACGRCTRRRGQPIPVAPPAPCGADRARHASPLHRERAPRAPHLARRLCAVPRRVRSRATSCRRGHACVTRRGQACLTRSGPEGRGDAASQYLGEALVYRATEGRSGPTPVVWESGTPDPSGPPGTVNAPYTVSRRTPCRARGRPTPRCGRHVTVASLTAPLGAAWVRHALPLYRNGAAPVPPGQALGCRALATWVGCNRPDVGVTRA